MSASVNASIGTNRTRPMADALTDGWDDTINSFAAALPDLSA
jgi:hypothetical protein